MIVTNRAAMQPDFATAIRDALEGGARLIQLRERDLPMRELKLLAIEASQMCRRYDGVLLINSEERLARVARAGVHWPEKHLGALREYSENLLSGASVHSAEAARRAESAGADYLVFGSVFPTTSHPNEAPAGLHNLRVVAQAVTIPVYAIGGINNEYSISACLQAGAFGVAIRSAVWQARDVRRKVEELTEIVESQARAL